MSDNVTLCRFYNGQGVDVLVVGALTRLLLVWFCGQESEATITCRHVACGVGNLSRDIEYVGSLFLSLQ